MEFVYKNRKAHVRIELKEPPTWVSGPSLQPWPQHLQSPPFPCATVSESPQTPGAQETLEAPQANSIPFLPHSGPHLQDEQIGPAEF